jgi:hypothetical protein
MAENNLVGRRCMTLIRCSTKEQSGESFPQQEAWLRDFADENQMIYVGEIQEALGVSQTEHRPDIDKLLKQAREQHDFDTVLVQDMSRLTRGGLIHGLRLYFQFEEVGVLIASITDGLIDTEDKVKEAIRRFEESQAAIKLSTLHMLRGRLKARKDGRCMYTHNASYGVDRKYLSADGTALHIIRDHSDGSQVQLMPDGVTEIRRFLPNNGKETKHYKKQRDEHVTLVPGDPERVAVVRRIFRRKFIDGWGGIRISDELNSEGILGPRGHKWHADTVRNILLNRIYTGVGVAGRLSDNPIFYQAGKSTPIAISPKATSLQDQACAFGTLKKYRPEADWHEQIFPELTDFLRLDEAVLERVRQWQMQYHRRRASRISALPGGGRYPDSAFFLRGILRTKQFDLAMCGSTVKGYKNKPYRYYVVRESSHKVRRTTIPAEALEKEIIEVLGDVFENVVEVEQVVRDVVHEQSASTSFDAQTIVRLKQEQKALQDQYDLYIENVGFIGKEKTKEKIDILRRKINDINNRISAAEDAESRANIDVEEIVKQVKVHCESVLASLDQMSPKDKRCLLQGVVRRMVVDLETRDVSLDLQLPSWMLKSDDSNGLVEVCAVATIPQDCRNGANHNWSIPIASYHCVQQRVKRKVCTKCSRVAVRRNHGDTAIAA